MLSFVNLWNFVRFVNFAVFTIFTNTEILVNFVIFGEFYETNFKLFLKEAVQRLERTETKTQQGWVPMQQAVFSFAANGHDNFTDKKKG